MHRISQQAHCIWLLLLHTTVVRYIHCITLAMNCVFLWQYNTPFTTYYLSILLLMDLVSTFSLVLLSGFFILIILFPDDNPLSTSVGISGHFKNILLLLVTFSSSWINSLNSLTMSNTWGHVCYDFSYFFPLYTL